MSLDFDPIFYTETMVRILREQGSTQHAMELAELILQREPGHQAVAQILEELRDEARQAFERFKNSGRPGEVPRPQIKEFEPELEAVGDLASQEEVMASIETSVETVVAIDPPEEVAVRPEVVNLTLVHGGQNVGIQKKKILRFSALLNRIQRIRGRDEAPST